MVRQLVNVGTPDGENGDDIRPGAIKTNASVSELYDRSLVWEENTPAFPVSWAVGDLIRHPILRKLFRCVVANSDAVFDPTKWAPVYCPCLDMQATVSGVLDLTVSDNFKIDLNGSVEVGLNGNVVNCHDYSLVINPSVAIANLTFDDTKFDIGEGVTVPVFDTVDRYAVVRMIGVNDRLFIESIAYRSAN